jgi:ligand-binding sensor domain-containing protein
MMNRLIKIALILLQSLLLQSQYCRSQILGYKSFKLEENNKQYLINTLYKNSDGYIFIASTNGIYKFDGITFTKIFFLDKTINETATAIFEDTQHQLWIGFKSGHIAKKINNHLIYYNPEEGTPQKAITCFAQDKNNNIWFGTKGEGIYYTYNNRIYVINEEDGLPDLNIHSITATNTGEILAATDQGISICKILGTKKQVSTITPKDGLPDYMVTSITQNSNNEFWVGLQDKGVCQYNSANKNIQLPKSATNWKYGQVNALLNSENRLWIATQDSGLIEYSNNIIRKIQFPNEKITNINSLLQDDQGNIWLANNENLIRISPNELTHYPLYSKQLFETIHALLVDNKKNIWISTGKIITKYYNQKDKFENKKYYITELTKNIDITSLYQDVYGNIWIGTMGKGIFVFNPQTGNYRQLNEIEKTGSTNILSITGKENTVCAGGLEGALVFQLNETNKNIAAKYNFASFNSNIGSNYIYNVFKDSKNRIWFATDGKGITVLDNGKYTNYDGDKILKDNHVFSITEDKQNNIWFSTSSAGIYKFDGNKFTNYNTENGLSNKNITAIKTDKQGNIIVIHPTGIDILNPSTNNISYVNNIQGINAISTDMGCISQDSTASIYFATATGVVQYNPQSIAPKKPKTIIEKIQLFLKDIDEKTINNFSYDENNLTFIITGLYYTDPENIFYQYKLEGFNNNWVSTKDKSITFPKLEPSKYKFIVRSAINDSFINATEASYEFKINKPFWKQWWFITSVVLFAVMLLFWYIKKREARLNHVQQLQQEKIQFQFQVLRNQINPHFLFNSFNTLIAIIEDGTAAAVNYVEQLANFFRNIVNYTDKEIITLQEELVLLNTYFYLQQKRYSNSLILNITVTEQEKNEILIPPLTLQLLIENAIKHNAVSKETPLTINIFTENNNRLITSNNINPKLSVQPGTGMGLKNIANRYNLLSQKSVIINNFDKKFIVSLPIIIAK